MFSPRFTFPTAQDDGPSTPIVAPSPAPAAAPAKKKDGDGKKGSLALDHLKHMMSTHFSDEDEDDEDEDDAEYEEGAAITTSMMSPGNALVPTATPESEEAAVSITATSPAVGPAPTTMQESEAPVVTLSPSIVAVPNAAPESEASITAPTDLTPPSPGTSPTKPAPLFPFPTRLMMSFSKKLGSNSSRGSAGSPSGSDKEADVARNPPPTPPPARDSSIALQCELVETNNNLNPTTTATATTTTTLRHVAEVVSSYPAPLASPSPVSFTQTRSSSSSSSTGADGEILLLSSSTTSTTENTAANTSSRTATTSLSSLGRASSESELLLEGSSPQVDLELCLGTITQLKDQLVHTNRTVEKLAAENVALQQELSVSRRTTAATAVSSFTNPGRRLLLRSSTTVGGGGAISGSSISSSSSNTGGMANKLSKSMPIRQLNGNTDKSITREDLPLDTTLSLQRSIDENTRTLAGFMEVLSKTQNAMEEAKDGNAGDLGHMSSSFSGGAALPMPVQSPAEAAMKEELQAAVSEMTALAQQFQSTLEEHRGDLAATLATSKTKEVASPRKEKLRLLSSRDASSDVSMAGLQNEVLRLQQRLRLMTTHASTEEKGLVEKVKALRQECGRLRSEVLSKEAETDVFRQEVQHMKASLRHTLEDRRRWSGELAKSQVASTSVAGIVASPSSTRVAGGAAAAVPPKETLQQEKMVALKGQVEDLESMLRLQMQIKSNVVLNLHAKRQEVHDLRDRLSLPPTTDAASRETVSYNTARRLKGAVELRHQARKQSEKKQSETLSKTQRQVQEERHRHHQMLRALQSQRLLYSQARAVRRAAKKEQQQQQGQQYQPEQTPGHHLLGTKFAQTKEQTNPSPQQRKLPSIPGARRASPDPVLAAPTATAAPSRTVSLREG